LQGVVHEMNTQYGAMKVTVDGDPLTQPVRSAS
jgi:hypothetical protein